MPGVCFNINEVVYFKLTTEGWVQYYTRRAAEKERMILNHSDPGWVNKMYAEYVLKSDSDGYCKMQLWEFMNIFGSQMRCGSKPMVDGNNIYLPIEKEASTNAPTK